MTTNTHYVSRTDPTHIRSGAGGRGTPLDLYNVLLYSCAAGAPADRKVAAEPVVHSDR